MIEYLNGMNIEDIENYHDVNDNNPPYLDIISYGMG